MRELLIVTGLSGAGKSLAMHALEDIGYYCIDNIPANLLVRLLEFAGHSEQPLERAAIVLDVRGARSAQEFSQALGQLREKGIIYPFYSWMPAMKCWSAAIKRRAAATRCAWRKISPLRRPFRKSALFWSPCLRRQITILTLRFYPLPS